MAGKKYFELNKVSNMFLLTNFSSCCSSSKWIQCKVQCCGFALFVIFFWCYSGVGRVWNFDWGGRQSIPVLLDRLTSFWDICHFATPAPCQKKNLKIYKCETKYTYYKQAEYPSPAWQTDVLLRRDILLPLPCAKS